MHARARAHTHTHTHTQHFARFATAYACMHARMHACSVYVNRKCPFYAYYTYRAYTRRTTATRPTYPTNPSTPEVSIIIPCR